MIPRSICNNSVNSYSEAVVWRCSVKKVLEILENSPENTFARVSFLIYLQASTLLKKRVRYRFYPVNFAKFLRTTFFTEHLRWLLLDILLNRSILLEMFYKTVVLKNFAKFTGFSF